MHELWTLFPSIFTYLKKVNEGDEKKQAEKT